MYKFEFAAPESLQEAIRLLKSPGSEALAGGTDILGELKRRIRRPERLVNMKSLRQFGGLEYNGELKIGSLVSLAELEHHPILPEKYPILSQASSFVGTPQLRNMGTAGGNLCQHPRCWYFRNRLFPCWLKGGKICFAVDGENKYHSILGRSMCHSVHPSDLAPALIALQGRVQIAGPQGERSIPLEELYSEPRPNHRRTNILKAGELIAAIQVPAPAAASRGIFLKSMDRKAWSFALVSLAVQLTLEKDQVADPRIVLGGVATIPWRAKEAEQFLSGKTLTAETAAQVAAEAVAGARPLRDNPYKLQLVRALMEEAFSALRRG